MSNSKLADERSNVQPSFADIGAGLIRTGEALQVATARAQCDLEAWLAAWKASK